MRHMRRMLLFWLLAALLLSCAGAWAVEEEWIHINETLDCDGLPMVVDADVLVLPAGTKGREYVLSSLTAKETAKIQNETDWLAMGFNPGTEAWNADGPIRWNKSYDEEGVQSISISPMNVVGMQDRNAYDRFPFTSNGRNLLTYTHSITETAPLTRITFEEVDAYARAVADMLGYEAGAPVAVKRWDVERIDAWRTRSIAEGQRYESLDGNLTDLECYKVVYPLYYQGLRLYSAACPPLPGEQSVVETSLFILYTNDGPVRVRYPVVDKMKPQKAEKTLMNEREALEKLRQLYANMYLPGVARIVVRTIAMEYAAHSPSESPRVDNNVYPTWCFQVIEEHEDGGIFNRTIGLHAVTGKQIF